ncbi:MAG: winged helix-turn-helix domain-containing protein, partial [Holophagales bacterium]|nr:winged helix-turn-helix domain-containing protein [Holophagales bacterium]
MRIRFAAFVYDSEAGTLHGPEGQIHLRPQVFELLGVLLRAAPRLVETHTLIDEVWRVPHVSQSSIQRSVSELRRALGDDAREPRFVATVHRRGYRFLEPVEGREETEAASAPSGAEDAEASELPSPGAATAGPDAPGGSEMASSTSHSAVPHDRTSDARFPDSAAPSGPPARSRLRRPGAVPAIGLGIALVLVAAWLVPREDRGPAGRSPESGAEVGAARPMLAVAELAGPPSGEDSWLASALAELISLHLLQQGEVRVLPRTSVERATKGEGWDATADPLELARLARVLPADAVLGGRYRFSDGPPPRRIGLALELVDGEGRSRLAIAIEGNEAELTELAARAAAELRRHLEGPLPRATPEAGPGLDAVLPERLSDTAELFRGLEALRRDDPVAARVRLETVAREAPASPLARWALARALH